MCPRGGYLLFGVPATAACMLDRLFDFELHMESRTQHVLWLRTALLTFRPKDAYYAPGAAQSIVGCG